MRRLVILVLLLSLPLAAQVQNPTIVTFAGGGPDNLPPLAAPLYDPLGIAFDSSGNLYVAAYGARRVFKIEKLVGGAWGNITLVAGIGSKGYSVDGTPALQAQLGDLWNVAADASGNVYFTESDTNRVRVVTPGNPPQLLSVSAIQGNPYGLVLAPDGHTLYFSDPNGPVVYKVDVSGGYPYPAPTIFAGVRYVTGYNGDNRAATSASLYWPTGLACDRSGNLFIADTYNNRVRKVDVSTGLISTVAGTGTGGFYGDTGLATLAQLAQPLNLAFDSAGNFYIADTGNQRVRKVDTNGFINTVVGTGTAGYSGDGGLALNAQLNSPAGLALDAQLNLFISDSGNNRIRALDANAYIQTFAGNGTVSYGGDTYPAISGNLDQPMDVVGDGAGNFYVADTANNRIRKIDSSGIMTTVAGNGVQTRSPDGSPAATSSIARPVAVAFYGGQVYFSELNQVSTIAGDGTLQTVATGLGMYLYGLAFDASGNLYISGSCWIFKRDPFAIVTAVAGSGICASSSDGVSAAGSPIWPYRLAFDSAGNLYFSEYQAHLVRRINASTGLLGTVAGSYGHRGYAGDGGLATSAYLSLPFGISLDSTTGSLYIAEQDNHVVRRVDSSGIINTFAGNHTAGLSGDGGLPTSARLNNPEGVWANGSSVYLADTLNNRIRLVSLPADITAPVTGFQLSPPANANGWNNTNTTVTLTANDGPFGSGSPQIFYNFTGAQAGSGAAYGNVQLQITTEGATNLSYYAVDAAGNIESTRSAAIKLDKTPPLPPIVSVTPAPDLYGVNHTDVTVTFNSGGDPGTVASGVAACTSPFAVVFDTNASTTYGYCWDLAGNYSTYSSATVKIDRAPPAPQPVITTVAGGGPDHVPAVLAYLAEIYGVATDSAGNFYLSAMYLHRVYKVDASGLLTLVAGNGEYGYSGDGGAATNAELGYPWGIAVDSAGNVYIADDGNYVVRKVDTNGIITTFAGTGSYGFSGDGGPAAAAQLGEPLDVAVDSLGNFYIADYDYCNIRKVATDGKISTFAGSPSGSCGSGGDNGPATGALLESPYSVAVDGAGNVYIADTWNYRVRKVDALTGIITTVAGTGNYGYSGDGSSATGASLGLIYGVEVDASGNLYLADEDYSVIRRVDAATGIISRVAGTVGSPAYSGDGGDATAAELDEPYAVAVAPNGTLYIADAYNYRVRGVDTAGIIHTVAGADYNTIAENVPATGAVLDYPNVVAADASGNFYFGDRYRIRKVNAGGVVSTYAGNGASGYSGDGGLATSANLYYPQGLALDAAGNLYIADSYVVRKVTPAGVISTYAGVWAQYVYNGDNVSATSAYLYAQGIAVDAAGNLYIADYYNNRIRKVAANGIITTVAGTGVAGFTGDGGLATAATLYEPLSVAVDAVGNLFISDQYGKAIRRVDAATGLITRYAGTGALCGDVCGYSYYFSGDGGSATQAAIFAYALAVDSSGVLYFPDPYNYRVRKVDSNGLIWTLAGGYGYYGDYYYDYDLGDGGPAYFAWLDYPQSVATAPNSAVYIADTYNQRIRRVGPGVPLPVADVYLEPGEAVEMMEGMHAHSIRVCNRGPNDASTVTLTDTLSRYTAMSASATQGSCTVTPALVTCQLGMIPLNGEAKVMIAVQPPKSGWASHYFQTNDAAYDPNLGNNAARLDNRDFGNTPEGDNVTVDLLESATGARASVAFARVARGGNTTLTTSSSASPPSGFRSAQPVRAFEIATSATVSSPIGVTLGTHGLAFHKPSRARLFHQENGAWVDRTTAVDLSSGKISALTDSLSAFALFEPENHAPVANVAGLVVPGVAPGGNTVRLNASGSTDPDGDPLSYRWTGPFPEGGGTVSGVAPSLTLPLGTSAVTLVVADAEAESQPVPVSVTVSDFDLSLARNNAAVTRGQAAVFTLNVSPKYGAFGSSVALACDPLPAGMACSFSPPAVTPGSQAAAVTLTVSTAGMAASAASPRRLYAMWLVLLPLGIVFLGAASSRRRICWLLALGLLAIGVLVACGGGSGSPAVSSSGGGVSATSTTVTITGSSGSLQRSTTATIVLN